MCRSPRPTLGSPLRTVDPRLTAEVGGSSPLRPTRIRRALHNANQKAPLSHAFDADEPTGSTYSRPPAANCITVTTRTTAPMAIQIRPRKRMEIGDVPNARNPRFDLYHPA